MTLKLNPAKENIPLSARETLDFLEKRGYKVDLEYSREGGYNATINDSDGKCLATAGGAKIGKAISSAYGSFVRTAAYQANWAGPQKGKVIG